MELVDATEATITRKDWGKEVFHITSYLIVMAVY